MVVLAFTRRCSQVFPIQTIFAMSRFGFLLTALLAATAALAFDDGVGKVPAMGYDTFNAFAENYDAALCLAQAKVMQESGLVAAGYTQFILDDFYAEKERNETGYMVANSTMFPDGIPAFSAQMKALGLQLAAYGDRGWATCGGYPGSFGHELLDLQTWYSWGMTYLKLDNCSKLRRFPGADKSTDLFRFSYRQHHPAKHLRRVLANEECYRRVCSGDRRDFHIFALRMGLGAALGMGKANWTILAHQQRHQAILVINRDDHHPGIISVLGVRLLRPQRSRHPRSR